MQRNKILIISAIIVVAGFVLAGVFMGSPKMVESPRISNDQLVRSYNPTLGNPNAKVTIVEFLDPECESCAAFYPAVKGLVNDYKEQVRFVVRYMFFHGNSKLAAQATEAAGKQGKYWEMQGQLFYRAQEWTHQETPQTAKFEEIAGILGLDIEKFRADMQDPQMIANIENDFKEGPGLGVTGTPTIFVNGRQLTELSYTALKKMVDDELKK